MAITRKKVVRFDLAQDPSFAQRLAREGDIDLTLAASDSRMRSPYAARDRLAA
jgi:hypothetical protein